MFKSRGMGSASAFTTRTHEVVTTGVFRCKIRYKMRPQKLINYCSILGYRERQVNGREGIPKARKSIKI